MYEVESKVEHWVHQNAGPKHLFEEALNLRAFATRAAVIEQTPFAGTNLQNYTNHDQTRRAN